MTGRTPSGASYVTRGEAGPVTLFVHGIAGSRDDCLPLSNGLAGTRVLLSLRGHDDAADLPADGWDWDTFATDIRQAIELTRARHVVAVSAGAAAVLHLLVVEPDLLLTATLLLPAVVDTPRGDDATARLARLGPLVEGRDVQAIARALVAELPAEVAGHRAAGIWAARRARLLCARTAPWPVTRLGAPVRSLADLAAVSAEVLVIAQREDPLHPVSVARTVAGAIPFARLEVLPPGGVFWTARERVATLIAHTVVSVSAMATALTKGAPKLTCSS